MDPVFDHSCDCRSVIRFFEFPPKALRAGRPGHMNTCARFKYRFREIIISFLNSEVFPRSLSCDQLSRLRITGHRGRKKKSRARSQTEKACSRRRGGVPAWGIGSVRTSPVCKNFRALLLFLRQILVFGSKLFRVLHGRYVMFQK